MNASQDNTVNIPLAEPAPEPSPQNEMAKQLFQVPVAVHLPLLKQPDAVTRNLIDHVFASHYRAAIVNQNASSVCAKVASQGSLNFKTSIIAGICALGQRHGPVTAARWVFESAGENEIKNIVAAGQYVPGFGNSFFKETIDPSWLDVVKVIQQDFPDSWKRIETIKAFIGKPIHPNAAMFTAVACVHAGVPNGVEDLFLILPRIGAWGQLCLC